MKVTNSDWLVRRRCRRWRPYWPASRTCGTMPVRQRVSSFQLLSRYQIPILAPQKFTDIFSLLPFERGPAPHDEFEPDSGTIVGGQVNLGNVVHIDDLVPDSNQHRKVPFQKRTSFAKAGSGIMRVPDRPFLVQVSDQFLQPLLSHHRIAHGERLGAGLFEPVLEH